MTHKRRQQASDNPFEQSEENAESADFSLFDVDAAIYGEISAIDAERQIAEPINITDIYPDVAQPRRAIPSAVRQYWDGQPESTGVLFDTWTRIANRERNMRGQPAIDFGDYLMGEETMRSTVGPDGSPEQEEFSPTEASLIELAELAASIHRDGLTNPITVAPLGNQYRLETGERRWLAFHLLYIWFGAGAEKSKRWEKIPARVVERVSVWRQASENNARANLNAIAKARQFALLLIDVYTQTGYTFQPYEALVAPNESDLAYYAQVADGSRFDIPRGSGEKFVNAMGMKDGSQVRQLRQLLRLPDIVWQWADDLNWTIGRVRGLITQANSEEELIWLATHQAARDGLSVSIDTPQPAKDAPKPAPTPGSKQHFSRVVKALVNSGPGKTRQNRRALEMLSEHKRWLEEQEQRLREYFE